MVADASSTRLHGLRCMLLLLFRELGGTVVVLKIWFSGGGVAGTAMMFLSRLWP